MSNNILNSYFILETVSEVPNDCIKILENKETKSGIPKISFKARLQKSEERNGNGRIYSKSICQEITSILQPKARARSLFQEVDHPLVADNSPSAKARAATISLKNCGTILRDIYMDGDSVIGEVETLTGFLGPDLYNLIVYDKADIGFSLRMFGRVETEGTTGLSRVVRPIKPITYDTVTNPSHKTAKVISFIPENINEFIDNTEITMENQNILYESEILSENINLSNNNQNVYEYLDMLIKETFYKINPVRFKF